MSENERPAVSPTLTADQAKRFLHAYRARRSRLLAQASLCRADEHEVSMLNEDIARMENLLRRLALSRTKAPQ